MIRINDTLDRIGRRWTLYWGSMGMSMDIYCFVVGGLSRVTADAAPGNKSNHGGAATFFIFIFTAIIGAAWLTVPWLHPAEIVFVRNSCER